MDLLRWWNNHDIVYNEFVNFKLFLKAQFFTLVFLAFFFFLTLLGLSGVAFAKFRQFSKASGLSFNQVKEIVKAGWQIEPQHADGKINFLLLGLDSLETRGNVPPLTDTMMLVSLDLNSAKVNTLSFPRDLWHDGYQTRINALYYYGQERYPEKPATFPQQVLSEMTGVNIHHPIVVSFEQVSGLIDLLGGVEVDVPIGFTDEEFPRTDVDVTVVTDPNLLYKTVVFQPGRQVMSGDRAMEYMRSRKSGDDEGTDVARGARQQLILDSLLAKLRQKNTLTNPNLLGQLYRYYEQNFAQVISVSELIAIAKRLYLVSGQFAVSNHTLSIYPDDDQGVIFHPNPRLYKGEWVYVVRDVPIFIEFVNEKLSN